MNIYTRKKRWKLILAVAALIFIAASLWYTNVLVGMISEDERSNIEIWANAIQQKAELVNYTERFFEQVRVEEIKRAELLADAYTNILSDNNNNSEVLDYYLKIITYNTTIPIILTDKYDSIRNERNVDINFDGIDKLQGDLKKEFSEFDPIILNYFENEYVKLYFKESKIYTDLRQVLDDLIESFFSEVVSNSASVPVIITDSTKSNILEFGNVDEKRIEDSAYVQKLIQDMEEENPPIEIHLVGQGRKYIFYKDTVLLTNLIYYPYVQFGIIGLFIIIAYLMFSTARRSEQNQVWVGMSKETAHQLGTPLSSMIAWLELMDMKGIKDEGIDEIKKDVKRLQSITDRFSKIGSTPKLENANVVQVVYDSVNYIKSRTSDRISYKINPDEDIIITAPINIPLFEWVIENLCKNAIDAMGGQGTLSVDISDEDKFLNIDINDTGKGIQKSLQKTIFNPGYTSKKRGWGLGLSLSKRIIQDYHRGKIFVKASAIKQGTTIRIVLKK